MALSGNFVKESQQQKANKVKQISDFKVRVLDFIAIYVKESKKPNSVGDEGKKIDFLKLIKGLLKSL